MPLFDASFYELNIHAIPDDNQTISRFAFEAKRYGYSGIAIINSKVTYQGKPDDFSIYSGIEIQCRPPKLRDEIKRHRDETDILIVRGGDEALNRAAVDTEGLDVLLQPVQFNHVLARIAVDNSITIGFNIGSIIRMRGEPRVRELIIMRTNLKYARKYSLPVILTSDARSPYDLRSPREMAALASLFGMTMKEAVDAMSVTPSWILKRKCRDYIREGIEII